MNHELFEEIVGIVVSLRSQSKYLGYGELILKINVPFQTKFIEFVAKSEILNSCKVNAGIKAVYKFRTELNANELSEVEEIILDDCGRCLCFFEAENAQRVECPECSLIDDSDAFEKLREQLRFIGYISYPPNDYNASWCRLEFKDTIFGHIYQSQWIFKNNPLFSCIKSLYKDKVYFVTAWKLFSRRESYTPNDPIPRFKLIFIDLLEIVADNDDKNQ